MYFEDNRLNIDSDYLDLKMTKTTLVVLVSVDGALQFHPVVSFALAFDSQKVPPIAVFAAQQDAVEFC
jgi:hypothetical protein